jgi:hypothetical protein
LPTSGLTVAETISTIRGSIPLYMRVPIIFRLFLFYSNNMIQ